ncbi:hypothetical protein B0T18DRAFT_385517 [Schizothecium vesticola]|uniref:Uncharacterized protein n=1 Tax=Schizothecium vesticola TaxID=314040 RepID=A0AA40F927_9PEZI|nr:hypothetical protein B0T18DRAFT_385517 [Schizothecium vesticola]
MSCLRQGRSVQCSRPSAGTCLATKSRALRDRVVSAAPKQARGGEDLQICLIICTTGFGLGTGLEGQLGQPSSSGLKSGDHGTPLFTRPDNLRVCIRGKQWEWITAKPSHERQANAKSDDVRPVLPPEPVVGEGWTFGCRFGK